MIRISIDGIYEDDTLVEGSLEVINDLILIGTFKGSSIDIYQLLFTIVYSSNNKISYNIDYLEYFTLYTNLFYSKESIERNYENRYTNNLRTNIKEALLKSNQITINHYLKKDVRCLDVNIIKYDGIDFIHIKKTDFLNTFFKYSKPLKDRYDFKNIELTNRKMVWIIMLDYFFRSYEYDSYIFDFSFIKNIFNIRTKDREISVLDYLKSNLIIDSFEINKDSFIINKRKDFKGITKKK